MGGFTEREVESYWLGGENISLPEKGNKDICFHADGEMRQEAFLESPGSRSQKPFNF
jgi:hypothetical protein